MFIELEIHGPQGVPQVLSDIDGGRAELCVYIMRVRVSVSEPEAN